MAVTVRSISRLKRTVTDCECMPAKATTPPRAPPPQTMIEFGSESTDRRWACQRMWGSRVILLLYVWGSTQRSAEDFLPRNLRLPDECPRLRKSRRDAGAGRVSAGGNGGTGRPGSLQYLFHPR